MSKHLTHHEWCEKYDIEEMSGIGSGCSFNTLKSWTKPAWDYQQKRIEQLESDLIELNELRKQIRELENMNIELEKRETELVDLVAEGIKDHISISDKDGEEYLRRLENAVFDYGDEEE